jgi:MinD-like ATPase involved in chromosome partitioning or flagellar assembly
MKMLTQKKANCWIERLPESMNMKKSVVMYKPKSPASKTIAALAKSLSK